MRQNSYTTEQMEFLRDGYLKMNTLDLARAFNARFGQARTEAAIRSALRRWGFTCGRARKDRYMTYRRVITEEQGKWIRENHPGVPRAEFTRRFNKHFNSSITPDQIKSYCKNNKINSGLSGHFTAGQVPWNKGKKGYMGANKTSFKTGNEPHNTNRLWHERISKDGYVEISVPETNPHTGYPRRYRAKHSWLWEQYYGAIPQGHVVIFKDGDKGNITLGNLMLVRRAELLRLNKHRYKEAPGEVKASVMALAKLEVKLFEKGKGA